MIKKVLDMKKLPWRTVAVALCLAALNCRSPFAPTVPLDELLEAPLQIDIDGRPYTLETYLWRDFMPPSEPNGSPLAAAVYITAIDGLPFPAEVDANRLWVVHGEKIWETGFSGESRPRDPGHPHQLAKYASGGPKWDTGIQVEVIVRVRTLSGKAFLLRATKQVIYRTE
jgi:hypothetical protein